MEEETPQLIYAEQHNAEAREQLARAFHCLQEPE